MHYISFFWALSLLLVSASAQSAVIFSSLYASDQSSVVASQQPDTLITDAPGASSSDINDGNAALSTRPVTDPVLTTLGSSYTTPTASASLMTCTFTDVVDTVELNSITYTTEYVTSPTESSCDTYITITMTKTLVAFDAPDDSPTDSVTEGPGDNARTKDAEPSLGLNSGPVMRRPEVTPSVSFSPLPTARSTIATNPRGRINNLLPKISEPDLGHINVPSIPAPTQPVPGSNPEGPAQPVPTAPASVFLRPNPLPLNGSIGGGQVIGGGGGGGVIIGGNQGGGIGVGRPGLHTKPPSNRTKDSVGGLGSNPAPTHTTKNPQTEVPAIIKVSEDELGDPPMPQPTLLAPHNDPIILVPVAAQTTKAATVQSSPGNPSSPDHSGQNHPAPPPPPPPHLVTETRKAASLATQVVTAHLAPRPLPPVIVTSTLPPKTHISASIIPARVTTRTTVLPRSTHVTQSVIPPHVVARTTTVGGTTHIILTTTPAHVTTLTTVVDGKTSESLITIAPRVTSITSVDGGRVITKMFTEPPRTVQFTTVDGPSTVVQTFTEPPMTVSYTSVENGQVVVMTESQGYETGGITLVTEVRAYTNTYMTVVPEGTDGAYPPPPGEATAGAIGIDTRRATTVALYVLIGAIWMLI